MSTPELDKWLDENFGDAPPIAKAAAIDGYEFAMKQAGWRCVKTDPPPVGVLVIATRVRRGGKSATDPIMCCVSSGGDWEDARGHRIHCGSHGYYVSQFMTHWMPRPDTSMLIRGGES